MKKKITVVFSIMLVLFNFIYCKSYAEEATVVPSTTTVTTNPTEQLIPRDEEGQPIDTTGMGSSFGESSTTLEDMAGNSKEYDIKKYVSSSSGSTFGIINSIWSFIVGGWLNNIPQFVVEATGCEVIDGTFTIYDLVMGRYEFFNLNFYKMETLTGKEGNTAVEKIVSNIFKYYFQLRNLALAISVFVLLYIAIRMALSTAVTDKARYKHMLTAWFTSIVIIFFMHYIVIIISYMAHFLLQIVNQLSQIMGVENIERGIFNGEVTTLQNNNKGFHLIQSLLLTTVFVYYEIKFLIIYVKRFCKMAFLIMISPLVTVTYSIDKVGDNRAQAFQAWFKELMTLYGIQVVHALMYTIFIAAAGAIAQAVPVIAVFFLWGMGKAESTIKKVIGIKDDQSLEKTNAPKAPRGLPGFLAARRRKA